MTVKISVNKNKKKQFNLIQRYKHQFRAQRNLMSKSVCVGVCVVSGSFPNLITVSERQERKMERGREVGEGGKEAGGRSPGKPSRQQ